MVRQDDAPVGGGCQAGVWAAWKGGRLLRETERNTGMFLRGNTMLPRDETETLNDLNLSKMMSHRWQVISHCPEEKPLTRCYRFNGILPLT